MSKSYSELSRLINFEDRYNYLKLKGVVGETIFGSDRYLNQSLYTSRRWLKARDQVIMRDDGCDLGIKDYEIKDKIFIHHMNPITMSDIVNGNPVIFNTEFLICVSYYTHLAIHYGDASLLPKLPIARFSGDTCPWGQKRGT